MEENGGVTSSDERAWTFRVSCAEGTLGTVGVTGDCDSLGNWSSKIIIPLSYSEKTKLWSKTINIPANRDVQYRYYTCTENNSKIMIHQWETNFQPRVIKVDQTNGEIDENPDEFGIFDGSRKIENGWITDDVVVEFRLNRNSVNWVSSSLNDSKVMVKLKRAPSDQSNGLSPQIWITTSNDDGKFVKQNDDGYQFDEVDQAVFLTRTFALDQQGFVFEFAVSSDDRTKKYYSFVVVENKIHGSRGSLKVPIHAVDHEYVGSLNVKYLIIRPLPDVNCSFKVSYAKYWNNSWTGLEIGHRGTGVSFGNTTEKNKVRENTIGSFRTAVQSGAHLIEFDVQLTNDFVPTIYHDFHVLLEVQNKVEKPTKRKMIFPFHKLTYEELKDFKIHHLTESNGSYSFENDDHEDYSPFPSLESVLHAVDPQIGFNIEIKYTSELHDGSHECEHPIDLNEYVDRILQVVHAHAARRYIVFSSFSPDVCAMARLKQNKYPVMFLTQGMTRRYPMYLDRRMKNIENAIHFANSFDLLGIVAHSEDLLGDTELVNLVLNSKLVLFCWGDDCNDNNNIAKLKEHGVHGIIFDRIDKLGQKLKKDIFENGIL